MQARCSWLRAAMKAFICLAVASASLVFAADAKPNIIFILTDDQGYGDLGRHDHPLLKTPHLDRLHDGSVRFENHYVSPSCSPTRAALLTGMHEFRNGVTHTVSPREHLSKDAVLLPQLLRDAGYRSGFIGKWHLGSDADHAPEARGFDWTSTNHGGVNKHFNPEIIRNGERMKREGFREDLFFDEAMTFIEESGDQPFFCYLATYSPHAPYSAPDEYVAPFRGKVTDKQAAYLGMIANIDHNVGRLMKFLEERELAGNTIVIFMNDNGVTEGLDIFNAGMRGCKCTIWQGGTRAMSFWHWPARWQPHQADNLTAHLDVLPTLCELAGAKVPDTLRGKLDGFSMVPLLESAQPVDWHPDRMLFQHVARWPGGLAASHKHAMCAVRQGHHLLLRSTPCEDSACRAQVSQCTTLLRVRAGTKKATYTEDNAQFHWGVSPEGGWVLFDVKKDPECLQDLATSEADLAARMASAYDRWWGQTYPEMIAAGGDREAVRTHSAGAGLGADSSTQTTATRKPATAPSGRAASFPRIDKDGDKFLSRDEFISFYKGVFTRKDRNGDGTLTIGEHPESSLSAMDKDKDGKVTPGEWEQLFNRQFGGLDADGDDKLTLDEMANPKPRPAPEEEPQPKEEPAPPKANLFKGIDANADGQASRDEFIAFYKGTFTRKDTNGDGVLTTGEHPDASLNAMDKDKDGKVTPAEWEALFDRQFKARDKNADGKLTPDE
ncbi:MAG: sulfatase-like hydrolase/transferase [Haloferula sp.]